jgi:conjugative transposon TraK protein
MFQQIKNIDTAFKHIRLFTVVLVIICAAICIYAIYKTTELSNVAQNRIYLLANDKVLEAYASERKDNLPVEAKDHIKIFHLYFFSLDPDEKVIASNTTQALYLADASAKRQYDNLKESSFYSNLIAANMSQEIKVDSVLLNTAHYPYYFKCFATEKLIRTTSIVTRDLVTEGYLRNTSRSDHNPHGFLIERWQIIQNKDIKIENR